MSAVGRGYWLALTAALGLVGMSPAHAALSIAPLTWPVVGLDSNDVNVGPNRFPQGARICSDTGTSGNPVEATFEFTTANSLINLRPGSLTTIDLGPLTAGACADAYFEVEITRNAAAYNTTRGFRILANVVGNPGSTVITPQPRELYVERLISQNRNSITSVAFGPVGGPLTLVGPGGALNLVIGNSYDIRISGGTATQGYEQFVAFAGLSNSIFRIFAVQTSLSADTSPWVSSPNDRLYADACSWESDPNSPNYRSCNGVGKAGGTFTTIYSVEIISTSASSETLSSVIYDFSGSSYHYNADYEAGGRTINIIDESSASFSKSFSPSTIGQNGVSTLRFTIGNPNAVAIAGYHFTDPLPAGLVVANPPNANTSGCGTATFAPSAGSTSLSFSNGTVSAGDACVVSVQVTGAAAGAYNNVSNPLFVGTANTGLVATATLTITDVPPLPAGTCSAGTAFVPLARWTLDGATLPPTPSVQHPLVGTASASFTGPSNSIYAGNPTNAWGGNGWPASNAALSATYSSYWQFTVDTSQFYGVRIGLQSNYTPNGDWAAGNNQGIAIYSSADGAAFLPAQAPIFAVQTLSKNAWNTIVPATTGSTATNTTATLTGSSTTTFRVMASGVGTSPNLAAFALLDNIVIEGCPPEPRISKVFSPDPIAVGQVTTLTFTLYNPSLAVTGVNFSDTLPAGLQVASPAGAGTTGCGAPTFAPAAGSTTLNFSGGSIAAQGTCVVNVNVLGVTAGVKLNVSGNLATTQTGVNDGPNGSATDEMAVLAPPVISKRFLPGSIPEGSTALLQFTVLNPNPDNALSSVAFSDSFPAGMQVANPPLASTSGCGTPTFSPTAGSTVLTLSGATLAAGGTCTVNVRVTVATAGTYPNTTSVVSTVINSATVNGNTASATLVATPLQPGIQLVKDIAASASGPWVNSLSVVPPQAVYYRFVIENTGTAPLTGVTLTDPLVSTVTCPAIPNPLPAPDATDDDHIYSCVVGPIPSAPGTLVNTAMANGTYGPTPVSDSDTATYNSISLGFDKSASPTSYTNAGDVVNYSFTVTNLGPASLAGPVVVVDDRTSDETCPALSTIGDQDNFFDPGENIVCSATLTMTAAHVPPNASFVLNTAFATVGGRDTSTDFALVTHSTVPVTLSDVSSQWTGGQLRVEFGTVAEAGTLGFSVELDAERGGPALQVGDLQASRGDSLLPRRYSLVAHTHRRPERFWIVEHTVIGATHRHGPYVTGLSVGEAPVLQPIDWPGIHLELDQYRQRERQRARERGGQGVMEVELPVAVDGWVELNEAQLLDVGMVLRGRPWTELALYRGDELVPYAWNGPEVLDGTGRLRFYGLPVRDSLYTGTAVYRLRHAPGLGVPLRGIHAAPGAQLPLVTSVRTRLLHAPDRGYSFSAPVGDPWFAQRVLRNGNAPVSTLESFDLPPLLAQAEVDLIRVHLWGGTDYPITPDHSGKVSLNGLGLGDFRFDGLSAWTLEARLPRGGLQAGANQLGIELRPDTGLSVDVVHLESIEVWFRRDLVATGNLLDFEVDSSSSGAETLMRDGLEADPVPGCAGAPHTGCQTYRASGFTTSDLQVHRIRGAQIDRLDSVRIESVNGGGYTVRFSVPVQTGDRIRIEPLDPAAVNLTVRPVLETPDLLAPGPVDYLVISHPALLSGLDPLVAARTAQGLRVRVVDVEQIYRQFGDGTRQPQAIQTYLRQAARQLGVRQVLLVGGDTYDYFDRLGVQSVSFIPTWYRPTSEFVRFAPTDLPYADLDGDGLADLALGRLPVRSTAELTRLIAKTLAYATAPHAGRTLLVSDRDSAGVRFADLLASLPDLLGGTWIRSRVSLQDYPPGAAAQARTDLVNQVNAGQALLTYFGHSAPASWSQESLLTAGHVYGGALQNTASPTVLWQLGCYATYFVHPSYNTITHALLLQEQGGAAAVIGASGLTAVSHDLSWMQLLGPRLRLQSVGDAVQAAQRQLMDGGAGFEDIGVGGAILGDPALRVRQ